MKNENQGFTLELEGKTFYVGSDGKGLYVRKDKSPLYEMVKNKTEFSITEVEEEGRGTKVRKAMLEYFLKHINETISVWDLPYRHYSADAGGILIGNETFKAKYDNGYGDVFNRRVILLEKTRPYLLQKIRQPLRRAGFFVGKGYVYDYDIPEEAKPIYEVDGEYSVFQILDDKDVENPHLRPMPTGNMLIVRNV